MDYPLKLQNCTPEAIHAALAEGYNTAILPCASRDAPAAGYAPAHADHVTEAIALEVTRRLGTAFVAPLLAPGPLPTGSVFDPAAHPEDAAFAARLDETCMALAQNGVRYVVVIPGAVHPFKISDMCHAVQNRIYDAELRVVVLPFGDLMQRRRWQQDFLAEKLSISHLEASTPGLGEVSMLLALQPEAAPASPAGDLQRATPALGAELLDYLGESMAREIRARVLCRR